jgi:hypothetical protein
VNEIETEDMTAKKAEYSIPPGLTSCHTAIVDGYIVEGHVPAAEIKRMLSERPAVIGIAVAGMPMGSPGMNIDGFDDEPYDVVTFTEEGEIDIYASYQ